MTERITRLVGVFLAKTNVVSPDIVDDEIISRPYSLRRNRLRRERETALQRSFSSTIFYDRQTPGWSR